MIKALEIKTPIVFNLDFANNTIFSSFFFFLLIIDLYFLIRAAITQNFNTCRTRNFYRITSKEQKAEIEIHPVIAKAKMI